MIRIRRRIRIKSKRRIRICAGNKRNIMNRRIITRKRKIMIRRRKRN